MATGFAKGDSRALTFTISADDMQAFARASGDTSLIHTDAAFAQANGFRGPIVYGAQMMAKLSQMLGTLLPGSRGVSLAWSIEFEQPLYAGEEATLTLTVDHVSEAVGVLTSSYDIKRGADRIAKGRITSKILKA
jgi:3-hydroxybutyryl-CoA dehydratase